MECYLYYVLKYEIMHSQTEMYNLESTIHSQVIELDES